MKKYIIVKYATEHFGKAYVNYAAHPHSCTAKECNVTEEFFTNKNNAEEALKKMVELNPGVDYGIVEMLED